MALKQESVCMCICLYTIFKNLFGILLEKQLVKQHVYFYPIYVQIIYIYGRSYPYIIKQDLEGCPSNLWQ